MVKIAGALEANVLDKNLRKDREWALRWLIEVPDVSVSLCANILGPASKTKNKYQSEITVQMTLSEAAFVIENADKAKDSFSMYLAGVEGALRAFESIKKAKPDHTWPEMEDLVAKRDRGELAAFVKESMAGCK